MAAFDFLSDVFGESPKVARYDPVNLEQEQGRSIAGNIANFPDIARLGDLFSAYYAQTLNNILPGYSDLLSTGSKTAQMTMDAAIPLLRGEIPQDVKDQIARSTAFKSLLGGFSGSGMSKALTARDLGRTSLDLISAGAGLAERGGNSAQSWINTAKGGMMNPTGMFITPAMQAAVTESNNVRKQNWQQFQYNVDAAPNPVAKGISDTIMSLIGAYLGGGRGGSGGGQAGVAQYQNFGFAPSSNNVNWYGNASDTGYPKPGG